jgi:hypothetical protein
MDNIEDIYYNKYLKYKYLELKGSSSLYKKITGKSAKSQDKIDEENLYGPELLEKIKSNISAAKNNISTKPLFSTIPGQRIYDITTLDDLEWGSLLDLLDEIAQLRQENLLIRQEQIDIVKQIDPKFRPQPVLGVETVFNATQTVTTI